MGIQEETATYDGGEHFGRHTQVIYGNSYTTRRMGTQAGTGMDNTDEKKANWGTTGKVELMTSM